MFLNFTKDKSFFNYENRYFDEIPEELVAKSDFNNAIIFSIGCLKSNYTNIHYILLGIRKGIKLSGHNERDLIFKKENSYLGYKLLNDKGEIIN